MHRYSRIGGVPRDGHGIEEVTEWKVYISLFSATQIEWRFSEHCPISFGRAIITHYNTAPHCRRNTPTGRVTLNQNFVIPLFLRPRFRSVTHVCGGVCKGNGKVFHGAIAGYLLIRARRQYFDNFVSVQRLHSPPNRWNTPESLSNMNNGITTPITTLPRPQVIIDGTRPPSLPSLTLTGMIPRTHYGIRPPTGSTRDIPQIILSTRQKRRWCPFPNI